MALKIECRDQLQEKQVADAIWSAALRLFGEVGVSQAGLYLVHFNSENNHAVLRCSHTSLPMIKAAVASITKIDSKQAAVHLLRVSGSLKALGRKLSPQQ